MKLIFATKQNPQESLLQKAILGFSLNPIGFITWFWHPIRFIKNSFRKFLKFKLLIVIIEYLNWKYFDKNAIILCLELEVKSFCIVPLLKNLIWHFHTEKGESENWLSWIIFFLQFQKVPCKQSLTKQKYLEIKLGLAASSCRCWAGPRREG